MWLVRKRARSVRAQRGESVFLNAAFAAVLIGQGTSPLVNLLERLAASPQAVAARLDGEGDAAPVDCLEQIFNWLDAQVRGDPTVPFPDPECL